MKSFTLLILILGLSFNIQSQCEIGAIEAIPTPCDELGFFDVIIDFEYANVGTDGFSIQGNGVTYGTFFYENLPVTINDLEGDGVTPYEFVVRDLQLTECSNFTELGIINCDSSLCHIWNVDVFPQPCEAGFFYVHITFWHEGTGTQGFRVQGNGNNYGNFAYNDLPIIIGPLAGDGITQYEFVVIDNEFENCSDWAAIDPINCGGTGDCNIWDLIIDDHPCEAGMFNVLLDFEYENVSAAGFKLYVNYDLYESYSYTDLPLQSIGPFAGDGSTVYHFLVRDKEFEDCAEDANFGPVNCTGGNCEIGEIGVTILPCNDYNEFNVLIDFDYANTSDEFNIHGNGMDYGTFLYANLPIELGPFQGDGVTVYEFGILDVVHDDCGNATAIDPVSCDGETALINFTTQVVSCNAGMYELSMNFDVINSGNQGFMVVGNGEMYGSYEYAQLPIIIGPLSTDGSTPYHFIAKDKQFQSFGNWDKLIPFTCESLGIKDNITTTESVKVYPNPSYGSVSFENLEKEALEVIIYNSAGAETHSFSFTNTYKLHDLNAGIYYYRIIGAEGQVSSGKLIVTM